MLGAIWGFTRPFEQIWRFWRINFVRKLQKQACFENCVKFDSRRLHHFSSGNLQIHPLLSRRLHS